MGWEGVFIAPTRVPMYVKRRVLIEFATWMAKLKNPHKIAVKNIIKKYLL